MNRQEVVENIRALYERFARGDLAVVQDLFAENAICHVLGEGTFAVNYRGHDQLREFLARTLAEASTIRSVEVHDVLISDDHVVILSRHTFEREQDQAAILGADILHLNEVGKIEEYWSFAASESS